MRAPENLAAQMADKTDEELSAMFSGQRIGYPRLWIPQEPNYNGVALMRARYLSHLRYQKDSRYFLQFRHSSLSLWPQ
jgi:hypothetical protein